MEIHVFAGGPYTPLDWYWAADDGRIYSSKRNALVYQYDSAYRDFVAKVGGATPWPKDQFGKQTTAALAAVVAPYGITPSL